MIAIPNTMRRAILAALVATDGLLDDVEIHLYQNNYTPGPASVLGDFTEATFDGYAASDAVVWGTPFTDLLDNAVVAGGSKQFTSTGATTPNVVYGYYVTDAAGTGYKYAERFDNPVNIDGAAQAVVVLPLFSFGQ